MADSTTTTLYVVVLAGWFGLMCIVLRCCSTDEDQLHLQDHHEIDLSVLFNGLQPKPATTIVQGQPARFARVQALGANATAEPSAPAVDGEHWREGELGLERLEIPAATDLASAGPPLPSAQEVWSPIIALRTFVEPLTSRASAAFRNFHVSFFDGSEEAGGSGVGGIAVATATAVVAGGTSPPSAVAVAAAAAAADEEGRSSPGSGARECARQLEEPSARRNSCGMSTVILERELGVVASAAMSSGYGGAVLERDRVWEEEGKFADAEDTGDDDFVRRVAV
ncbi:unnamed protein product [Scytosiphon promiscuus]